MPDNAHNELGKAGEELARLHLAQKGYTILAINWTFQKKELDIVAQLGDVMVFVEVKTRSSLLFERPQEAVTKAKMRHLVFAADAYLTQHNIKLESRFDIVTVLNGPPPKVLEHIEGAFLPAELM